MGRESVMLYRISRGKDRDMETTRGGGGEEGIKVEGKEI